MNKEKQSTQHSSEKSTKSKTESQSKSDNKSRTKENVLLDKVLIESLMDIFDAEQQIKYALPKMVNAAYSDDLQQIFEDHLKETDLQIERLKEVFTELQVEVGEHKCEAMEGIIKEGEEIINKYKPSFGRDAMLIAAAQKVEHYEIASYGSIIAFADTLDDRWVGDILEVSLKEEKRADKNLTEVAEDFVNKRSASFVEKEVQKESTLSEY